MLNKWLQKISALHPKSIDLGLERVRTVAHRLGITKCCPLITVAGTNGKGSVVAGLEAIYLQANYRVGAFTTPYLFKFNEIVRIQGQEATDEQFIQAFQLIDAARKEISLTVFEFNTLAALLIFQAADLDLWILEVGLGGRLDAVNLLDADIAIVTSIDIDHAEILGDTREKIAKEKAGIFRRGRPAICGDFSPPITLMEEANRIQAIWYCQNEHFKFTVQQTDWVWEGLNNRWRLPFPKLALQNMSTVLMAIELLLPIFPLVEQDLYTALSKVTLPARIQVIPGEVTTILDVSHNPASAQWLKNYLVNNPGTGKTLAVFSMLADKDILTTLNMMQKAIDEWFVAPLLFERAASLPYLKTAFQRAGISAVKFFLTIKEAYEMAQAHSQIDDRIVAFGSFHTIAEIKH